MLINFIPNFRNKLGSNFKYGGIQSIFELLRDHPNSFALAIEEFSVNHWKIILDNQRIENEERDVDVLQENLGDNQFPLVLILHFFFNSFESDFNLIDLIVYFKVH